MTARTTLDDLVWDYIMADYNRQNDETTRNKLFQKLQSTSVQERYRSLFDNMQNDYGMCSSLNAASRVGDLELIRCMLKGFTSQQTYELIKKSEMAIHDSKDIEVVYSLLGNLTREQKFNIIKLKEDSYYSKGTVLQTKYENLEIVSYLLFECETQQQKFDVLSVKDYCGDTFLHLGARSGWRAQDRVILSSVTPDQQTHLLNIKNKSGETVNDILRSQHPIRGIDMRLDKELEASSKRAEDLEVSVSALSKKCDQLQKEKDHQNKELQTLTNRQAELERLIVDLQIQHRTAFYTGNALDQENPI